MESTQASSRRGLGGGMNVGWGVTRVREGWAGRGESQERWGGGGGARVRKGWVGRVEEWDAAFGQV